MKSKLYIYLITPIIFCIIAAYSLLAFNFEGKYQIIDSSGTDMLNTFLQTVESNKVNNVKIIKHNTSTTNALKSLIDKSSNLVIADRKLTDSEKHLLKSNNFIVQPFARTYYVAITNNKSKLTNVTLDQLKKMLGTKNLNYNEINSSIKVGKVDMALPNDNCEYLTDFINKYFTNDPKNINYKNDSTLLTLIQNRIEKSKFSRVEDIISYVANKEDAVAIVPFSKVAHNENVKVLSINSKIVDSENLLNSTYPYNLDLSLIYRNDDGNKHETASKKLIDILNTDKYKKILLQPSQSNYLIPIK